MVANGEFLGSESLAHQRPEQAHKVSSSTFLFLFVCLWAVLGRLSARSVRFPFPIISYAFTRPVNIKRRIASCLAWFMHVMGNGFLFLFSFLLTRGPILLIVCLYVSVGHGIKKKRRKRKRLAQALGVACGPARKRSQSDWPTAPRQCWASASRLRLQSKFLVFTFLWLSGAEMTGSEAQAP